jgi:hypothetical protein
MLCARDGERCQACGCSKRIVWRNAGYGTGEQWGEYPWDTARFSQINPTSNLEVDHRTPLCQGGSNDDANLWLLCIPCHKAKTTAERRRRARAS